MADFTAKAIKESLVRLLNERPLNKITVKDIVEDCGINRNSFYYHFSDVPAVIEDIVKEEADRIIEAYPSIATLEEGFFAALRTSAPSIIVSGMGLFAATFGVAVYSNIDIISSMCMLMARGAIISVLCVLLLLPALLMLCDGVIRKTTLGMKTC